MPYILRGKIVAPDGEANNRREILINGKSEYNRLPFNEYPLTHQITPAGIGVTLINGRHRCEASFHRYEEDSRYGRIIYIGSATRRLGSWVYAEEFRNFLEAVGIVIAGTLVKLKFEGYRIYVNRIQ